MTLKHLERSKVVSRRTRRMVMAAAWLAGCADTTPATGLSEAQRANDDVEADGGTTDSGRGHTTGGGTGGETTGGTAGRASTSLNLDVRRSLVVTEQPILAGFTFQRVMDQLVSQAGVPGLTSLALFQQWWDTQNPGPGLGQGPHCDDQQDAVYGAVVNGYPYACRGPMAEGGEAACDPFAPNSPCAYIPVALFNRFDLAPANGANCGEHRIIFARASGRTDASARNLIIFEAVLPNPHLGQGLKGCKKIADFWGDLSKEGSLTKRAASLEHFYFDGLADIPPVVHVEHYGDNDSGSGQIRSNMFIQPTTISPRAWSLGEFKLLKTCQASVCDLDVVPVSDKTNPFGPLFNLPGTDPNSAAFKGYFPSVIADLAASSVPRIRMDIPDVYNAPRSQASGSIETNYRLNFGTDPNSFRSAIDTTLAGLGSSLTADDIVARAQTQSCAGCHRLSNNASLGGGLTWPSALGFTHVSEKDADVEVVDGISRYRISVALETEFLPHRKFVLEDYIENPPRNSHASKSIGGSTTH